jgi:arginine decarboxylase
LEHLYEKLLQNARGDMYPYHMPGHKRHGWGELPEELYRIDITEIEGFDNLHQPEGILQTLQKAASEIYGAEETYYLVNGSTCGILSAVSCALPFAGHILMARNCHKSAYYAAYLRHLKISYLYPQLLKEYGILEGITPAKVQEAMEREPDIGAVLVVSPTYEGRISDVAGIARVVHGKGIPLIVDEAHGAHLGLAEGFPQNSCQAGADLVIHSVHKTLPALTQTALLHVNGERIDRERLRRFLRIYQTSSPSYPLMASIDNALQYAALEGREAFKRFRLRYQKMLEALAGCSVLRFLPPEEAQDVGKLLIGVGEAGITGRQLYQILLDRYHLQTEMAAGQFVLAMFTVNDTQEAYERMTAALVEIDAGLAAGQVADKRRIEAPACRDEVQWELAQESLALDQAWEMETEYVTLQAGEGRYAGEFINLYPPGIPVAVPGECLDGKTCHYILQCVRQGLTVQGIHIEESSDALERRITFKVLKL